MAGTCFGLADEAQRTALGGVLSHAFGFPREGALPWLEKAGFDNVRAVTRGAEVVGGLIEVPMAQWFGGRSVSTMGVAGVAVAPGERGRGTGTWMMREMLRGARDRGFALSTLYPATVTLYRRAGYERAGARYELRMNPRAHDIPRASEIRIVETTGTPEELRALYSATAWREPGFLDRGPYVWDRVSNPRGMTTTTFLAKHGDVLEGYVVLAHKVLPTSYDTVVDVRDLAATTPRAARAILRLLTEYRSLAGTVRWEGPPNDVFASLLPERHVEIAILDYFMVRVIDVARAFAMRGWPRGAAGELTLDLTDASLPEGSGAYAIALADGKAAVRKGEAGPRVALDERALAALYTGFTRPHVLAAAGWLQADEDTLALLDAWFAGPLPTMRDMF